MATNPYLLDQSNAITQQANQNLNLGIMPGINSGAQMAGGYGGSRQGIAQGVAAGMTQQGITNSLASLNGNAWQADQSNQLQSKSLDNNYNLGLGNLGLGMQGQNNSFYTQNRQLDQSGMRLGADLAGMGNTGLSNQGTDIYNTGATANQAGWGALNNLSGVVNPYMQGTGTTQMSGPAASTIGSAFGGAIGGAQLWNLLNPSKP